MKITPNGVDICTLASFSESLWSKLQDQVFVTCLANERGAEQPKRIITRDVGEITRFVAKRDGPGHGVFFCVGTIFPQARRRAKENISEIIGLHADIDFNPFCSQIPQKFSGS